MGSALRIEGDPAGAGALKLAGRFGAAGGGIDCAAGEGDAAIHPNDRQAAFAAFPAQLSQDLLRGLQQGKIVDLGLLTGGKLPIGQAGDQNLDRIGVGDRLRQGVYHQIKRMFGVFDAGVNALHRESIGGVALDPALAPGQWRELTAEEVERLRTSSY